MPHDAYREVRALVLGASGFIGRWVARSLTAAGADLHLAVRDAERAASLFRTFRVSGATHVVDLEVEARVRELIRVVRPAVTFNLAGYGVDRLERDGETALHVNARLVEVVAEALADVSNLEWRGCRLLHAGSALEYGACGGDLAEETPPRPTTLYGRTKLEGTRRLSAISRQLGLRAATVRLFTVYGPGEHDGRLLPTLLQAARGSGPVQLSAGHQERDFSYVGDVADGLLRLGVSAAGPGEVINLARGEPTTVRRFAEIAAGVLAIDPDRLRFGALPVREEEMQHEPVRVLRLHQLTGWSPPRDIAAGVAEARDFH